MGIEFNKEQICAIYDIEHWWNSGTSDQVIEVSGAAGTGKTTLIMYFIERIGLKLDEVLFVAYMGKAANQMALNGLPAKTIHSAIYRLETRYVRDEKGKIVFKKNGEPKTKKVFALKEKLNKKIKLIVLDEGSMVNKEIGEDLLSFQIPVIVLGDLNQLPPVFGNPFFLKNPTIVLKKIMRQAENDPIIWLSQQVLAKKPLQVGVYGKSAVMNRNDLLPSHFSEANVTLTCTNRLRYNVNNFYRESIKRIVNLQYPHVGEKVVCRKNNWNKSIHKEFYLTNGTTGFVTYYYRDSFNGKTMKIDMRPDFSKEEFKNICFDYQRLFSVPGKNNNLEGNYFNDIIEFAYALTVHTTQGSQYPNVLFLNEENEMGGNEEFRRKLKYTAITRATKQIIIAM